MFWWGLIIGFFAGYAVCAYFAIKERLQLEKDLLEKEPPIVKLAGGWEAIAHTQEQEAEKYKSMAKKFENEKEKLEVAIKTGRGLAKIKKDLIELDKILSIEDINKITKKEQKK